MRPMTHTPQSSPFTPHTVGMRTLWRPLRRRAACTARWAAALMQAVSLLSLTVPAVPALAAPHLHPAVFAISPSRFPEGSRVIRAGIETNRQLRIDQAGHFGPPPGVLGRLTGYYMDVYTGSNTAQGSSNRHPYMSYLVSIFRAPRQAQTAYDLRWDFWFMHDYYTTPNSPPVKVGEFGAEALFQTLDPADPPLTELLFRRGAILVEVFRGTAGNSPDPGEMDAFWRIARDLDARAGSHPLGG